MKFQGTLKTITQRAYVICSITELLDTELKQLEQVFVEKNNYPKWVMRQIFTQVKFINDSNLSPPTTETRKVPANENETVTKKHMLLLLYQGDKGIGLTKSLKRNSNKHLPNNAKTQVTFASQKLSTQFNVKDRAKFEHKHDVIYFGKCPEQNCTDDYLRESARRISERIIDHGGRDQKSHLFRHTVVNNRGNASCDDIKIIGSGFRNNTFKRKVAEALLIKEFRATLNVQEKSVGLKRFIKFP